MATPYTALYRYFQWDGTQRESHSADDLMSALSDDFLQSGNIQQALKSLLRRGMPMSGQQRMPGIHDMIRKLREQRREQLQRYNLDSVFDALKEQLDEILAMEQTTVADWLEGRSDSADGQSSLPRDDVSQDGSPGESGGPSPQENPSVENHPEGAVAGDTSHSGQKPEGNFSSDMLKKIAARHQHELEQLPNDASGQIKALQDYEFLNPEAQQSFDKLMEQLRDAMTQTFFKDITEMVNSMSEGDLARMKDMVKAMNAMLVKKIAGEDPGFEQFMDQYGDMFGDNPPQSLDELLAQMEAQMGAAQSLMNSLSADQRGQLESLLDGKLGDPELQQELMKLGKELAFLNPQAGQHQFSGEEAIDFQAAMKLMDELQQMENLEQDLRGVRDFSDLDKIDEQLVKELLGEEGADDLNELKDLLDTLEKAGYLRKDGDGWEITPRGSRIIGQKALEEIYRKLKHADLGSHRSGKEGCFGDQQEDSKAYEFGDPLHLHIPRTLKNAIRREFSSETVTPKPGQKINLHPDDFEVHRHELNTKTSTVLLLDLSLSMALRDAFLPAKKVALALHNLITSRFPRDTLEIIGFSAYAREIKAKDLMTVDVDQFTMGTNIQHALLLAEKKLAREHTGTKQIIMISDGEPTAHLEDGYPYFEYPPNPVTIAKTLLAVKRCTQKNITINT
ncbi:MAG: VWA domain-containing protein, partial [Gammaproteobacteria bacterium]